MFCTKCGKQLPDDAVFCSACGTKTGEPDTAEHTEVNPPPVQPEYRISVNGNESGPYSLPQLTSMIQSGQVTADYWVCKSNSATWVKINEAPEFSFMFVSTQNTSTPNAETGKKRLLRHGFTSFWLWLNFLCGAFGVGFLALDLFSFKSQYMLQYIEAANVSKPSIFLWALRIYMVLFTRLSYAFKME